MIQLAWRFLMFQKNSALGAMVPHANSRSPRYHPQDYGRRPLPPQGQALARKLLVALWPLVTTGEMPEGVVLRPA